MIHLLRYIYTRYYYDRQQIAQGGQNTLGTDQQLSAQHLAKNLWVAQETSPIYIDGFYREQAQHNQSRILCCQWGT